MFSLSERLDIANELLPKTGVISHTKQYYYWNEWAWFQLGPPGL